MTSAEKYDEIIVNCFRLFGITELSTIEQMTMWEYNLRIKAYNLRMVDKEYELHLAAWTNREIESKRKSGKKLKYIYTKFKDFFDYRGRIADVTGQAEEKPETAADRVKRYYREKKDG